MNLDNELTEKEKLKIQKDSDFYFVKEDIERISKERDERISLIQGFDVIFNGLQFIIVGVKKRKCQNQIALLNEKGQQTYVSIDTAINSLIDKKLKSILIKTCSFLRFNKNPKNKNCGDCFIRAYATITNQSWEAVFIDLAKFACEFHDSMHSKITINSYLKEKGYECVVIPKRKIKDVAKEYPNGLIVTINHAVALVGGYYIDVKDCGSKIVHEMFIKKDMVN